MHRPTTRAEVLLCAPNLMSLATVTNIVRTTSKVITGLTCDDGQCLCLNWSVESIDLLRIKSGEVILSVERHTFTGKNTMPEAKLLGSDRLTLRGAKSPLPLLTMRYLIRGEPCIN